MVCRFPCLLLVCYLLYFGIGLVSPYVRFPSCVITAASPNEFQLLLVACPVCVWYLSPRLSFVPCRIILVCAEVCPVCYLCYLCSRCYRCSLPFELINDHLT